MNKSESIESVKASLELDESINLHKLSWKLQTVGWILVFAVIALAAIGLFGIGPVSTRQVTRGQTTVEYEKFLRRGAQTRILIRPEKTSGGFTKLAIPQSYLSCFELEKIVPDTYSATARENFIEYAFPFKEGYIQLYLVPNTTGTISSAWVVDSLETNFVHFIYP